MFSLPASIKELSRDSAMLCLEIEKRLLSFFPEITGRNFILGLSGGKDSTCLAVILTILSKRLGFGLMALHANHKMRPEAWEDEKFSRDLCKALSISFKAARFDLIKYAQLRKKGLEETGRDARRRIFENEKNATGADGIFLAHHSGDLLEDIVMRLIRGAGWPALGGMPEKSGFFYRPMLGISKKEICDFLIRENIRWVEDESNNSPFFFRNRIRHDFLPLLLKENPSLESGAVNLNRLAALDADYWQAELESFFNRHAESAASLYQLTLPVGALVKLHKAMRLRVYNRAFQILAERTGKRFQGVNSNFFLLDQALLEKKTGRIFQFPENFRAVLQKGNIVFFYKD